MESFYQWHLPDGCSTCDFGYSVILISDLIQSEIVGNKLLGFSESESSIVEGVC